MTDAVENLGSDDSESQQLISVLQSCVDLQSSDNLSYNDYNDKSISDTEIYHWQKMISPNSVSGNISTSSYASDDSVCDSILEESGRISLAYEDLRTIPRQIADKFAAHTKFLDLSYNKFQNLSFLSFFNGLDTLILDRNYNLEANTLPHLPNLKILWINNCNISNVTEWITRIQEHCPTLEQLSIMGNPGINGRFDLPTLSRPACVTKQDLFTNTLSTNYREYILNVLPQLLYLDGTQRSAVGQNCVIGGGDSGSNRTASSSSSCKLQNGIRGMVDGNKTTSASLSFKGLFHLNKRRKKAYHSSSTNS